MKINKEMKNKIQKLVIELGGSMTVCAIVCNEYKIDITRQAICNWYREGIPPKYIKFLCNRSERFKPEDFRPDLF